MSNYENADIIRITYRSNRMALATFYTDGASLDTLLADLATSKYAELDREIVVVA